MTDKTELFIVTFISLTNDRIITTLPITEKEVKTILAVGRDKKLDSPHVPISLNGEHGRVLHVTEELVSRCAVMYEPFVEDDNDVNED